MTAERVIIATTMNASSLPVTVLMHSPTAGSFYIGLRSRYQQNITNYMGAPWHRCRGVTITSIDTINSIIQACLIMKVDKEELL